MCVYLNFHILPSTFVAPNPCQIDAFNDTFQLLSYSNYLNNGKQSHPLAVYIHFLILSNSVYYNFVYFIKYHVLLV